MEQSTQPRRTKIVLADDEETIGELRDTTESPTAAGYITYHPAKRGEDHNTSGLRCIMAAIVRYYTMVHETGRFPTGVFGWMDVEPPE